MGKSKITFGKMNSNGPGNGGSIETLKGGESVGEIERFDDTVWSGMSRSYITGGYTVDFYDRVLAREFRVTARIDARAALAAAKDYVRQILEG